MRRQHNLLIGERSAEQIKIEVGSALTELENPPEDYAVQGRDLMTGTPKEIVVSYSEIAHALDKSIAKIQDAVLSALEMTPPELSADIYKTGLYLDGDGDLDLLTGISNGDLIYYPGCTPSAATISPTAVCSYTSPSGNVFTASNTYMDTIPNASGCDSVITINLTVNPVMDQAITAGTVCGTGSTTIDLASSQTGVNYYLRDNTNDTIVDGPLAGMNILR